MSNETSPMGKNRAEIFKVLDEINKYSSKGKLENYDSSEIIGETPPDYVPGVTHIKKDEELPGLKKWAEEHGKEALIIGTTIIGVATAVTLVIIGREVYLKHLKKDKE